MNYNKNQNKVKASLEKHYGFLRLNQFEFST